MSTGILSQSSNAHSVPGDRHYKRWTIGLWTGCLVASVSVFAERWAFEASANVPTLVGCAVSLTVTMLAVFVGMIVNFHDHDTPQRARNWRALVILLPSGFVAASFSGSSGLCDTFLLTQFVTGAITLIAFSAEHAGRLPESPMSSHTTLRIFVEPRSAKPKPISEMQSLREPTELQNNAAEVVRIQQEAGIAATTSVSQREQLTNCSDNEVLQIRRVQTAAEDRLEGQIRVDFAPGQQRQTVHVPFTPHFARLPTIDCEVSQTSVRSQVADARRYGARFELKRRHAERAEVVVLDMSAVDLAQSTCG